ncbi:MAG: C_GCAxxG_C_C family protein [Spirochaetaceae bacterium]|nr:MAG: C_GCAxxG_C_C family protein [Spirochaetaceae bacterium]
MPTRLSFLHQFKLNGLRGMCCGALLGAFAAVNLVTDSDRARTIVAELLEWYRTVAHSAFCKDSVINWMIESGYAHGNDQRKERCAKLTGDVAAKAVELLQSIRWKVGGY